MRTEVKVVIGTVLATIIILGGGIWFLSSRDVREQAKLAKSLIGQEIAIQGRSHIPDGTKVDYGTNPPTSGNHYASPQVGGIYDKAPADGNLVHSMEHGAVILWYKSDLPATQTAQLKEIFNKVFVGKKIMTPRDSLDAPLTLTSWGRLLKLQTIDEGQIKAFMETNEDRGPEKAPL